MSQTKVCSDCKEELPFDAFFARSKNDPRPRSRCKICYKIRFPRNPEYDHRLYMKNADTYKQRSYRHQLRSKYGIEEYDVETMLEKQGGCCAICGGLPSGKQKNKLCVDHDHETDTVRGMLCHNCNIALGLMNDDPNRLRLAAAYLERSV